MNNSDEIIISRILKFGVITSALLVLVGICLFLSNHNSNIGPSAGQSYKQYLTAGFKIPHSISSIGTSLKNDSGLGLITLGILLMIITPMLRVATSILLFLRQRNIPMVLVTIFVLFVLVTSFVIGILT